MLKVEHIGIAVESVVNSIPLFEKLLNTPCYKTEDVWSENVKTAFFKTGDTKIELLQSLTNDGVIKKFLDKKGQCIHHIAFEVENIYDEIERLKKEGFEFINDKSKPGADNKLICFLNPKNANGILIELCQHYPTDIGVSPQKIENIS